MLGIIITTFWAILAVIATLALFGPELAATFENVFNTWLSFIKSISVLNFIQNSDILAVIFWTFEVCARTAVLLFITSYGITQWFGFNSINWRKTAWVIVCLVFVFLLVTIKVRIPVNMFYQHIWVPWIFPIFIGAIPLILLIVDSIKQRFVKKAQ